MLQLQRAFRPTFVAFTLLTAVAASAQGTGGGNGVATNASGAGAAQGTEVTGGLGNPGAPQGAPGVNVSSTSASPNAVPTVGNGAGIDTSLSTAQSANDPNIATETQQRIGDREQGQEEGFDWGLLGLLDLLGLLGLKSRRA